MQYLFVINFHGIVWITCVKSPGQPWFSDKDQDGLASKFQFLWNFMKAMMFINF